MRVVANGIGIEVDDQGPPDGEPLLMIMGLGMQLIGWPDELVQLLVARGFRVIRFDNRDTGLSDGFDHLGVPHLPWIGLRHAMHLPVRSPYSLADMACDAVGVLDALGIGQAHVCGASMGGMIAQHLAASHSPRVKSLTLIMTTSGSRKLPQPGLRVQHALLSRPDGNDLDAAAAYFQRLLGIIGSPAYPPDPVRLHERVTATVRRAYRPRGTARQIAAVVADGDRSAMLARITAPTRIIHGAADPLVPVACGQELAARIAGAQADFVPGMGHDLPLQLLERFADGIRDNARRGDNLG
jgi:pimeloyl-ACP methyl ester carboxylesterase